MARSSPSGGTDAVRRSLDSRQVDAESEDRPYLVSMLRRLGYTDAQIQDYLAGRAEPGVSSAAPPAAVPAPPTPAPRAAQPSRAEPSPGEPRDVEVEYTGPGLQDYRLVDPVEFFGEPARTDDGDLVEFQAGEAASAAEDAWAEVAPDAAADVGSDGQPLVEFASTPAAEPEAAWIPEPEPAPEPAPDEVEAPAPDLAAWEAVPEEPAAAPEPEEPVPEAPAPPEMQVIEYGDYTLYHKDDVQDGQPARVYAFSKSAPGEGYEPADAVPDGYEVAENPETGRPFLRRLGEEDWGVAEAAPTTPGPAGAAGEPTRRRVRLKRVRAANREEAMRLVEREGGNPLASVPIDIEKRLGDA